MHKLLLSTLCLFFVVSACKKNPDTNSDTVETNNQKVIEKDISNIDYTEFLLDEKTEKIVNDWAEYKQLQDIIDNFKQADLSFLIENKEAIDTLLKDFKKNVPESLKSPSITARISAFETMFLKLESLSNLSTTNKTELLETIENTLVAFSNLNLQMNKKVEIDGQNIQKP